MPPRRSSRSTRASIEPTATEILPGKRKRVAVADTDNQEKENADSTLSRPKRAPSARSSEAPPPKLRTSSRTKLLLPELEEDEEPDDSPEPMRKKARPSAETNNKSVEGTVEDDNDEEIMDTKPTRARRSGIALKKERATTLDNDEPLLQPASRRSSSRQSTASSLAKSNPSTRASRMTRATRSAAPAVDGEEEEEEEDVKPLMNSGRRSSRATTSAASKISRTSTGSVEEAVYVSSDEDSYSRPVPKGRRSKATLPVPKRGPVKKALKAVDPDESDELQPPPPGQARPQSNQEKELSTVEAASLQTQEEEDERSLFDPLPMPAPSTLPKTMPEEPSGPKSRLVIHKMALINFKSYAGRQEIGPFHKSFSSIVGPNGSGKSNTIDALLFVFGYRASKMRQAKVSELIHNSARYPDLDECSVEVHFREIVDLPGPDAYKVVPESRLIVTRQAYKNNSSKYTVNGKSSTYTEVQTLLKGRGIDLDHKRFLILQGEVESIAQMKPKAPSEHEDGLLEYLEDIIGTSKYKEPIDQALVEMERLQEERSIKMNRLRLVEKEKSALEDKKREAEDFLRLKNEHARAQSRLWQWLIWQCLMNEEEWQTKIAKINKDLVDETERNKDDVTHLELLKKHYEERQKAYEEVQAAAAAAVKDLAATEKREVGLQERQKHAKSKSKKLKKSIQDDTTTRNNALREIEDSSAKMKREKVKLDEHEVSLEQEEKILEGIRDSLKDKTQVFHDKIEGKQKELQPWTAKINKTQAEIDVANSERDALTEKANALMASSRDATENLEKLKTEQQEKVAEQERLVERRTNLVAQRQTADRNLQEVQGKVKEWRGKATASRQKIDEAKASQSENRSQGRVLDTLLKLKDQGRIEGFYGRLGSLGTIPDKYDIAITTACGSLNHMVVDKVEQGQACIEYLRTQNVGRASFMVLDKLHKTNGMDKIDTPENVPRLFDLIKPKEARFAPAFYKAISNTLVADDLEQANRIAYGAKRWRVVTLAGQMIETSGAMSGGGGQPARGGMSSKLASESVRPEVLRNYEQESEHATRKLQEVLDEMATLEGELDRLNRSGPDIDMSHEKLVLEIEQGKKKIIEAEKRVKEIKSRTGPNAGDLARIKTLDGDIATAMKQLEAQQAQADEIKEAIKNLEESILKIGGSKLLAQKSKVDGIRLHINLANDEITKAEVSHAKAVKDAAKLEAAVESNTASLEEIDAELNGLNEELAGLQSYIAEVREKVEAAQAAAENEKDDLEHLKAEVDEKEEEISEFRKKEMDLQQQLADAQKELKDNNRSLEHWQTEHDNLKLEVIEDDEEEDEEEEHHTENPVDPVEGSDEVKMESDERPVSKKKTKKLPSDVFHEYSPQELAKFKKAELTAHALVLDEKIKKAKPDLSVLKEYKRREEEFLNRAKDLEDITNERDAQKQTYDGLRKQRLDEFMAGFNLISLKLKEMYQMITLGGNAELELVDSLDPFSEGIIFSVMPPKKSWKNISNLSGGEKTLSSLALVFALHVFKPTPLYFMDEIDAALDFRNVSIVANYIKDRTKNAQFIIISLRNDMFELSHRLIGIYKTANATRSISIDNHALTSLPPSATAV